MPKIKYDSNSSGGIWWLKDKDWYDLETAGWVVRWMKDDEFYSEYVRESGRWLGALATSATREGLSLEDAIAEFESITGQNSEDEGCECCGQPHYFYEEI